MPSHETMSLHQLNTATLARQFLLRPTHLNHVQAIQQLCGLQAQYPPSPYIALWTRLAKFRRDDLTKSINQYEVVKATLMRGTMHLVSSQEYFSCAAAMTQSRGSRYWLRRATSQTDMRTIQRLYHLALKFTSQARTREEMVEFLNKVGPPGRKWKPADLPFRAVGALGGFLRAVPSGIWGSHGEGKRIAAPSVLPDTKRLTIREALAFLVHRYLAAFGPASKEDLVKWSDIQIGLLQPALESLKPHLSTFRDEKGRMLIDLADASKPGADTVVPIRFLPKWDNVMLAYATSARERILPHKYYRR